MKLKTNLHFHTNEDPSHPAISYDIKQGIDEMAKRDFRVLAITCHRKFVCTQKHIDYAKSKGIFLIPGIEADIYEGTRKNHVVILNCNKDIEGIKTFQELTEYKKNNPQIFIIAPHPFLHGTHSLLKLLEKYIDLFDAIENSWFYSKHFNINKRAFEIAKKYNKPFISTSDTHFLDFVDKSYIIVETLELTSQSIFNSIKNNQFTNITSPRNFWTDIMYRVGIFILRDLFYNLFKK